MAKTVTVELRAKQTFKDKETNTIYKKGKVYSFSEKRAEELLKNSYLVELVAEISATTVGETAKEEENIAK